MENEHSRLDKAQHADRIRLSKLNYVGDEAIDIRKNMYIRTRQLRVINRVELEIKKRRMKILKNNDKLY